MNDENTNDEYQDSQLSLRLDQQTDNELLVLFVDRQCEAAFNELVSRHSRMVLSICRSVVWNQDCAEDAFQATFLALVRNAKRIRSANSLSGWLCRVARHAAIKASKMQRSKEGQSNNIDSIEPTIELDPLTQLAAREVVQSLAEELETMPTRFKEVLTLSYFESLSRSEIAARMDCTEMAVKSLLQRGKRLLRARLMRKGIVPGMIALGIQAIGRLTQACDTNALISETTATCATALFSTNGSVPSNLSDLSKAADWKLLNLNLIVAKSILATCAITVAAVPILLSSSFALARNGTTIVAQQTSEEPAGNSAGSIRVMDTELHAENPAENESNYVESDKLLTSKTEFGSNEDTAASTAKLAQVQPHPLAPLARPQSLPKPNLPLNHRIDTRLDFNISTGTN